MTPRSRIGRLIQVFAAASLLLGTAAFAQSPEDVANEVIEIEKERIRLMVAGDIAAADPYHADDFVLINPFGVELRKFDILNTVNAGDLEFVRQEITDYQVRVYGDAAVLRYRGPIEVRFQGQPVPEQLLWHLVTYEKRDGRWQIVWSIASEVRPGP